MKNLKLISLTTCLSILLLTVALLTINNSFSLVDNEKVWDVHFETTNKQVIIDDTRVDFYSDLKLGDSYVLDLDVVNNGSFNSNLYRILYSDLSKEKISDSKYTYNDFLNINIIYGDNNNINSISKDSSIQTFDLLKAHTKNNIKVIVSFDENKLNKEKKDYLSSHGNKLNINLFLQLNYKEV